MNTDPFQFFTDEQKEALRKKRQLGLRKLGSLGLLISGVCVVAIIIGIASIIVQKDGRYVPYVLGLAIVAGASMLPAGIFAMLAARRGRDEQDLSSSVRCYVIVVFVFCTISVTFCSLIMVFGGILGIIFCEIDDEKTNHLCKQSHDANLALSVLTMLVSFVLFILAIMGTCFFCFYGRSFGFKSKYERRMEMQMMRMQAMQQQGQQITFQQYSQPGMNMQQYSQPGMNMQQYSQPGGTAQLSLEPVSAKGFSY